LQRLAVHRQRHRAVRIRRQRSHVQTNDADIKQVKTSSAFRRAFQTKDGSFKIVLKTGEDKDGVKFSFAPLTNDIAESKMIIRLIGKND